MWCVLDCFYAKLWSIKCRSTLALTLRRYEIVQCKAEFPNFYRKLHRNSVTFSPIHRIQNFFSVMYVYYRVHTILQ